VLVVRGNQQPAERGLFCMTIEQHHRAT